MQDFIKNISIFIWDIFYDFLVSIYQFSSSSSTYQQSYQIQLSELNFNTFVDKQIFSGDLVSIGITWRELFNYFLPLFLVVFFIVLFVRFIWSLLTIIKDSATKWR